MKLPNRLSCELGAAIKAALKSGRRRQKALAGHLGITASAVSQMLHGRLLPDREKMEAILEFLMADARLSGLLMELWRRSRLGDFPERSDFNRRFGAHNEIFDRTQRIIELANHIDEEE